jgi:membrane protease YdiL (CAAX protease family)
MEELIAENQLLYTFLNWLLLGSGLVIAGLLILYLRQHRPNQAELTRNLIRDAWTTPQVGILLATLVLLYFLASFLGLFFYEETLPLVKLSYTLIMYGVVLLLITRIIHKRGGSWGTSCGMGTAHAQQLYLSPILYLAFVPFLLLISKGYHLLLEAITQNDTELQSVAEIVTQEFSWIQMLYIGMAIVIAPIYEELLFRGIIFPYLVKRIGLTKGIITLSLFFAGLHFHLPSIAPLFLLSIVLCLAYWRTGSLWVSIGVHTIFNTVSILSLSITS